jgi:hypothetical protein
MQYPYPIYTIHFVNPTASVSSYPKPYPPEILELVQELLRKSKYVPTLKSSEKMNNIF